MVVIVLTAVPIGLRGVLTKYLLEISAGVFVGRVSARVRDAIWARIIEMCDNGRAIMAFSANNEQGLEFKVHRHDWEVVDLDGLRLIRRPHDRELPGNPMKSGWSKQSRYRRSRR